MCNKYKSYKYPVKLRVMRVALDDGPRELNCVH